jgi:hypothetical protein
MDCQKLNDIAQSGTMIAEFQALPEKSQAVIHGIKSIFFLSNAYRYNPGEGEMIEGDILRRFQWLKTVCNSDTMNQIGRKWLQMDHFDIMPIVMQAWKRFEVWQRLDIARCIQQKARQIEKQNKDRREPDD